MDELHLTRHTLTIARRVYCGAVRHGAAIRGRFLRIIAHTIVAVERRCRCDGGKKDTRQGQNRPITNPSLKNHGYHPLESSTCSHALKRNIPEVKTAARSIFSLPTTTRHQ